ncbi:MAG: carbamoyl phosphate synthase large subunit [Gammaproteobacteria bacterium RIFCSPLOWO2_02_FULL_42_14]|nr:MAG: carbamoyl phosphate synthase large subunit [Gammaproteobacteria bacterium RIFCSPHIGHO2_02_FULL_42_43]OGT28631.1 MAG: carbamoyl phosphate synthase large subunit [Gammaproteobacteria bacterium RIFCSPHIGHO2_01_FULL_42_8]OGT52321.1 MAG: carbamoyl phosphate synthase large subunit [Gammaproteobacteria bacterium RIFCSPHIGHO2_12_FULL_41_25]OGT61933.1 MAG: carbamoyl phosphate synthase large subunit [Gammaproteobacteria bacterium RIFCSPLOWO2_02_FULL_42_14]OGT86356.1 MAG: carbamoyl phosphate synth
MPKRADIQTILIIGAGPIVIGQACEFDYSGTQACVALRELGFRVVLINSNPATIMTDPTMADVIYIEPIQWSVVARIIEKERPDALLPTMGGQTALNCALDLAREGVLKKYNVELIGASREAIDKAEDRELFAKSMQKIGLKTPRSGIAHTMADALRIVEEIGFPVVIRPSFTLGGTGGGIAYHRDELIDICERGFDLSPTHELLIDESIIGWKEFELEVVRDCKDNCIIVCSIENMDPMGIHTGDSITVAPAQTLTDKEYQCMRDAAIAILREIGVDTGGSNVQFALNPKNGEMMVIEMNPRVSRSSALASKATGFPIARIAAKLAVGFTLDELQNEMTNGKTPASFEPTIDYVVTKIPRFAFGKFPQLNKRLTTQMKSVGEVMAIGSNFQESLQKAIRGLEINAHGLEPKIRVIADSDSYQYDCEEAREKIRRELRMATHERLWFIADAFRFGFSCDEIAAHTHIDPWFLAQIEALVVIENKISEKKLDAITREELFYIKQKGFSDARIATLLNTTEEEVRSKRDAFHLHPVYKRIDTCSAEFSTDTAYFYSTYQSEDESRPTQREKIMVLGGGPNRIGQGLEFDYCCVHAALAMRELGFETIMVNCNPETVSTDFHISDRLYFEPVTLEDVLEIVRIEKPKGVIVQLGGQTPLKLTHALEKAGVPIVGTPPDSIDLAEDRARFQALIHELKLQQPANNIVRSKEEGLRFAKEVTYPIIVRPSYVLGGRNMKIIFHEREFYDYIRSIKEVSLKNPLLLDHFLDDAIEVDIDAISDGKEIFIAGIMEHIEQAGVHSGDSSCVFPPHSLSEAIQNQLREQMEKLARALRVVGLMNAQFAIQHNEIYILEVNPRASRTVPFLAKATGLPLVAIAARCMAGVSLSEQSIQRKNNAYISVKKPIFPFTKFKNVDPILGPEMRSTGEVMGIATSLGSAFLKAELAANSKIPLSGTAFISVRDADKPRVVAIAKKLIALGFHLLSTAGTARALRDAQLACDVVNKVEEGRPHIVDRMCNNDVQLVINTTEGEKAIADSFTIRRCAVERGICYTTTLAGAEAVCLAIETREIGEIVNIKNNQ